MPVSVQQWRVEIGTFSCRYILRYPQNCNFFMKGKTVVVRFAFGCMLNFFLTLYFCCILLTHGDIEVNPGPRKNCSTSFSFCHWNLDSLIAHNYVKLSSLQAYNSVYKHDAICLSETYLDNSVPSDESDLNFPGYKLVRADYPGNVKRGGVCIYFKESLSIRFLDVPNNLDECLLCELSYKNKKCFIATLYRSPSQSREEFEKFLRNFEVLIKAISNQKDAISIIMGDFNARSSNWCKYDISNNEGVQIDSVTSTHGLEQLISELTHILSNSSSCIDLIFTNQPNLVADSGTHPSLHPNCHHHIIHSKINLQVEYPPPYQRHVWNYAKANKDAMLSALQNVDWHRLFAEKTVHQQVNLLNDIILNIFTNFVPNKVITCDDRDPPCINDNIKNKTKWENSMYKKL